VTPIFLVGLATLAASFVCSLLEAALYTITPSQIELLKSHGVKGADRLARFRRDVEEPIAAILTLNTIAHTIGSAWCGAMVGQRFGNEAVGIFAAIFTFLVLVITEIIPKSLGVRYAKTLGPWITWPLQWLVWIALPVARPAKAAMRRLTGGGEHRGPTEEEVLSFSRLAAQSGEVRKDEHRWVRNALRLDRVTAKDLRTPRTVIETFPADTPIAEVGELVARWEHSRIPLFEPNETDRLIGVVYRREAVDAALLEESGAGGEARTLRELAHPLELLPETIPAHELLDHFLRRKTHMVALADEYGGFEGVCTLEDVLECLLGAEIVDEHDRHVDLQDVARRRNPLGSADAARNRTAKTPSERNTDP